MILINTIRLMLQFNFKQKFINIAPIIALLIVLLLGIGVQSSEAILTMKLSDGTTTIMLVDNALAANIGDPYDSLDAVGGIVYNGGVGMFNLNVSTAITKPIIGSSSYPELHLSSVSVSSGSEFGGTLTITLSDIGFDAFSVTGFRSDIGGVSSGTVTLNNYLSESNTPFAMDYNIGTFSTDNQGSFSGSDSYSITPTSIFSLTTEINLTHAGGTLISSFGTHVKPDLNLSISVVPEPISSLLFITGATLMAGMRFRKSYKKNY